jgi:RNA recognition motif-containing protein
MDVDNTTPRASSPNTQFFDNLENSSNIDLMRNAQQPQQPESQRSTSTSAISKIGNLQNASDASFNKEISPLSNVSQHAKDQHVSSQDINMEFSDNDVIKADALTFLAAVPFNEIKKPEESNRQTYDHLNDYFVANFSSFIKYYTTGKVSDNSKKLVVRLGDKTEYNKLINTQDSTLKITENADIPQFLSYNPSTIKAEQNSHSIHVRDIPLFIKESEVRSHFRKFGFIESLYMSIRRGSLFQFAYITFEDSDHVTQFHELIWSTILKGNFLRIYPASLNIEQQNAKKQYTIVLRNLPQNTKGSDLINIINDTQAKSISIPIHRKSLKPKTWAYFAFKDETIMNNAKDTIRTLKDNQLVWDTTDNVKNFCVRCSSPLYKPDQCDAFSSRGRKPIPQHIMDKYKKFGHNPRFVQTERVVLPLITTLVETYLHQDHALETIPEIIQHNPTKEYHMPKQPSVLLSLQKLKDPHRIIKGRNRCTLSFLLLTTIITEKIILSKSFKLNLI